MLDAGCFSVHSKVGKRCFVPFSLANRRPLFHCRGMESHELLREIFDKKNPKEVSADLELSTSMVYKWAQPRAGEGSGIENPLDRVEAL